MHVSRTNHYDLTRSSLSKADSGNHDSNKQDAKEGQELIDRSRALALARSSADPGRAGPGRAWPAAVSCTFFDPTRMRAL